MDGMIRLMDEFGNDKNMHGGINENKENVTISIFADKVVVDTLQQNHWVRKNTYWRDGTCEETYEGKWE